MFVVFTSENSNMVGVVAYGRVKPFRLIVIVVSGRRFKLLDPILD